MVEQVKGQLHTHSEEMKTLTGDISGKFDSIMKLLQKRPGPEEDGKTGKAPRVH